MAFDIARVRNDFPILSREVSGQPLVYLDNAATTQKPQAVIDALVRFYSEQNANVHRGSHQLSVEATELFESARKRVLHFLNAGPDRQLVWTRGVTEGINLVAQGWLAPRLQAGDEVLISALEHHANLVPWQQVCQRAGATLKVIPLTPDGTLNLDRFAQLLGKRTRLLAVTQVSNALGVVTPLESMIAQAKALGVPVLVDGAQAVGHFAIDLSALGADFYLFSGHKLFAPTGIGGLCLTSEMAELMAPVMFGGEMVETVSFENSRFVTPPLCFEAGTPNIAGVIGLAAAVEYLQSLDVGERLRHEQAVYRAMEGALVQIKGVNVLAASADKVGALSFTVEGEHGFDLGVWLDRSGIAVRTGHHCAMPLMQALGIGGTVRASIAFYNTIDEVERLAEVLARRLNSPERVSVIAAEPLPLFWQRLQADELVQAFNDAGVWQKRYRLLMQLGKELATTPAVRDQGRLIAGCESRVWLFKQVQGECHWFAFDSDSRLIKGMAVVLLAAVNGKTSGEIRAFDFSGYLERIGLQRHLSPSRGNGLQAMVQAVLAVVES